VHVLLISPLNTGKQVQKCNIHTWQTIRCTNVWHNWCRLFTFVSFFNTDAINMSVSIFVHSVA
jgi:hypothetical protein